MVAAEAPGAAPASNEWRAHPKQERFLRLSCFEALYGGAAGGGKSEALIIGAARLAGERRHRALLLRREFPELQRTILARTEEIYPHIGGHWHAKTKTWYFESGARIELGSCENEKDVRKWDGAEFNFIGIDEASHWTAYMYRFLISRCRTAHGLPLRFRATTNPGGVGHDFMLSRFAPWLYPPNAPEYDGVRAKHGDVLHFLPREGKQEGEDVVHPSTPGAIARSFIGARVADNPSIGADYERNLGLLDPLTRAQKRDGDWLMRPGNRVFFKREKFRIVERADVPEDALHVRWWDRAATEDPRADWTVGVELAYLKPTWWIVDIIRGQWEPAEVKSRIEAQTKIDARNDVRVVLARDPASAGKFEAMVYLADLAEYDVHAVPDQRGKASEGVDVKVVRARPVSAQADQGNIRVVRAPWNAAFFNEAEDFPLGDFDDQIDALSGAYRQTLTLWPAHVKVRGGSRRVPNSNPLRSGGY
jgi:predicted phage terminase large subunit-like protein